MFNIRLVNIGGDRLVTEFGSNLDTLAEVEAFVTGEINKHLGIQCALLVHDEDLLYRVWVNGHDVGFVSIKSVSSKTKESIGENDTRK